MNLYKIKFVHFAPRGQEEGIYTYIAAQDDEDVYEWLKLNRTTKDGNQIYVSYEDYERDGHTFDIYDAEYEIIGQQSYKDRMIDIRGSYYDDDLDIGDAYYGVTAVGWKQVSTGVVTMAHVALMNMMGINIEVTDTYKEVYEAYTQN